MTEYIEYYRLVEKKCPKCGKVTEDTEKVAMPDMKKRYEYNTICKDCVQ